MYQEKTLKDNFYSGLISKKYFYDVQYLKSEFFFKAQNANVISVSLTYVLFIEENIQ